MTPERLAEIDIAIDMFRHTHPGSFGEMVSDLRAEVDRLTEESASRWHLAENSHADVVTSLQGWDQGLAERDQARDLARSLVQAIELWVGFPAIRSIDFTQLPNWLTAEASGQPAANPGVPE